MVQVIAAVIAEPDNDPKDRALVDAGQPHDGADRIAFRQEPQNLNLFVPVEVDWPSDSPCSLGRIAVDLWLQGRSLAIRRILVRPGWPPSLPGFSSRLLL